MNKKNYNSGELKVGKDEKNRFISSSFIDDTKKSSIAIISSILVLAIITCTFFALFGEFNFTFPAWNSKDDDTTTSVPEVPKSYIATSGGVDLSEFELYAGNVILIKLSDMTTVAHKNADNIFLPASMTKVMTILAALDYIENLDDEYVITKEVLDKMPYGSSHANLSYYIGNKVSIRDLLYGVSYESGADSVLCLIDSIGFTWDEFTTLMNKKAKEIGLQNTTFGGAIGMDAEGNQTTCRDIAAMMAYAMENPICIELFGGTEYKCDLIPRTYHNGTLYDTVNDFDDKANGYDATPENILEGYTLLAAKSGAESIPGYCLVSYIQNNETGEKFILVTGNTQYEKPPYRRVRILDMKKIFSALNP